MPAAQRCWSAAHGRCLLAVCCTLLAAGQCWQLLQLFLQEPVSSTTSLTPAPEVQLPSVTICLRPLGNESSPRPGNVSIAEALWPGLGSPGAILAKCQPGCLPTGVKVGFPGVSKAVMIGTWRSWMSSGGKTSKYRHELCHTLDPNVTWGQIPDEAYGESAGIMIALFANPANSSDRYEYEVAIHPRRRPVLFPHGIRGLRPDTRFTVEERTVVTAHVSRYIIDHESLRRAPCVTTPGYDKKTCIINHFFSTWAKEKNCSWLETLQDYPHLPPCSRAELRTLRQLFPDRSDYHTACPPACRWEVVTSDITTTSDVTTSTDRPRAVADRARLRVVHSEIPERVNTERLSYRAVSMFSEMGGYISLLLGVSALSLADLAGQVVSWCRTAVGGRRRKVTTTTSIRPILVQP